VKPHHWCAQERSQRRRSKYNGTEAGEGEEEEVKEPEDEREHKEGVHGRTVGWPAQSNKGDGKMEVDLKLLRRSPGRLTGKGKVVG